MFTARCSPARAVFLIVIRAGRKRVSRILMRRTERRRKGSFYWAPPPPAVPVQREQFFLPDTPVSPGLCAANRVQGRLLCLSASLLFRSGNKINFYNNGKFFRYPFDPCLTDCFFIVRSAPTLRNKRILPGGQSLTAMSVRPWSSVFCFGFFRSDVSFRA